jgi:hypothetical protein
MACNISDCSQRATQIVLYDDDVTPFSIGFDDSSIDIQALEVRACDLQDTQSLETASALNLGICAGRKRAVNIAQEWRIAKC